MEHIEKQNMNTFVGLCSPFCFARWLVFALGRFPHRTAAIARKLSQGSNAVSDYESMFIYCARTYLYQ
jgi:hypothetical protein